MTHSYAPEIVVPQITAQEAQRRFRQGEFLRRNHHLISPWMYTPQQYEARNRALFLRSVDMALTSRDLYASNSPGLAALLPTEPVDAP